MVGHLLVTVIVVLIVTAQSSQTSNANGIRVENLGASIHPHLEMSKSKLLRYQRITFHLKV